MRKPLRPQLPYTKLQQFIADTFHSEEYMQDRHVIIDYSLYDRCTVGPGAWTPETFRFYVDLDLPSGERKPYADTNMWLSGYLPMPMAFSLTKSLFFLMSRKMHEDDLKQLLDTYVWELRLGRKCYAKGPMARFPNRIRFDEIEPQPFTAPVDDPALAERNRQWIEKQPEERRYRPNLLKHAPEVFDTQIPLVIEQEVHFCVEVIGKSFLTTHKGTGINIMCDMEGVAAMGIQ